MRAFIEHLQKKTIPHDMLEDFRKAGVKFYDGWLIVKVVDHKSVAKAAATTGAEAEDDKPFSIHNYNTFITPSPYVPYPKQQSTNKSPVMKQELGVVPDKRINGGHPSPSTLGETGSDDAARPSSKPGKPQPRIFHVALRPTNLSKHMDLVLASMELDLKSSLNRKQSQVFNARTPGSAGTMAAPLSLDTSGAGDKGPVSKKRKLRIAPDQMIHFERSVTNHTAPPLCLDLVHSLEEAEAQMLILRDPLYDQQPPSPKSRKRTVAELAADDALAKEQERFMLIMAGDGGGAGANAGVVDGQAAGAMFQPDFGKFNTIQQIKFQTAEKQKREEERRMHDDANKRLQEEERKRHQELMRLQQQQAQQQQQAERHRHLQLQEQKRVAVQAAAAQQQQQQLQMQQQVQAQQQAQQNAQQMAQLSGVPPNMQNQMRQGQAMSSLDMRQSTPHGNSSPIMNNGQAQAVPMATQGSQQGMAGSPARPGSAMQHGHPGVAMARGPSNQGPSRNGTPQIPQNTPAMRQATPVMRQGTPSQRISQASPHPGMMAPTPQMQQAQMMAPGQQMPNGMHYPQNAQQLVMQQQRNQAMQQAAMQQGMMAGNPALAQAQMAHMQAQRVANADQQALLQHRQRQAAAAHQAQLQQAQQQQQIGTPQQTAPSPANSAQHAQNQYSQNLRNQLQNQMQQVANHGSSAPSQGQPTTQQQMAQLQRQQQAATQAGQMNQQMGQPGMQMSPQQQMMRNAQMQQMQQAQYNQMNPQQQAQMQQMMLQQRAHAQSQMSPQQLAAMHQQQAQAQQRPTYPPQVQANMAKIRDQRIIHHTTKLANDRYAGNVQMIQPNEQQDIKRMAFQDAQTWARKWQANNVAQGQRAAMMAQQQAQQQQMGGLPGQQQ
jgi:transcription factor SPT20